MAALAFMVLLQQRNNANPEKQSYEFMLGLFVMGFASIVVILLLNQNKLLYVPLCQVVADHEPKTPRLSCNPPDLQEPKIPYESLILFSKSEKDTKQVPIHAWLFRAANAKATLIYCHGNAGNIGHRLALWHLMVQKFPEYHLICFDYRGFGNSHGEPSEIGLIADCLACGEYAKKNLKVSIVLLGTSLGGAVSMSAWEKKPSLFAGVILENTFTSVCDVAMVALPMIYPLKPLLKRYPKVFLTNIFDTKGIIQRNVDNLCPLLILCAEDDEIIPPVQSKELYLDTQQKATFASFPLARHSDVPFIAGEPYFDHITKFVNELL